MGRVRGGSGIGGGSGRGRISGRGRCIHAYIVKCATSRKEKTKLVISKALVNSMLKYGGKNSADEM